MVNDPYKILGVSRNADTEEIKRAYRELSRKYHPDSYVNNPLSDLAEEKFKEVQEAYAQIMNERSGSYHAGSGGHDGYTDAGPGYRQNTGDGYQGNAGNGMFTDVRAMLNRRQYYDALNILRPMGNRNAEWHYCYAVASFGVGNNADALAHAQQAVNMAPGNTEYASFLSHLSNRNGRYQQNPVYSGRGGGSCTGDTCCDLFIADKCCECMGGDLCSCF